LALHATLAASVALLALIVVVKTRPHDKVSRPAPDLSRLTVLDTAGWTRRSDESVLAFAQALNTSTLRQESYFRGDTQVTVYFAYWAPNQATLGSVALHSPAMCLPGSGWQTLMAPSKLAAYPLRTPRRFAFKKNGYPQHVWFWHFYDGEPVEETAGFYPWQLAPRLLRPAVSANAPQWVVRISSNKPLESLLAEPIVQEFFARLRAAGLTESAS
ncbi:MAG: hypothetical protein RIQ93_406, partial [Verrucomicrobiota bacterium]